MFNQLIRILIIVFYFTLPLAAVADGDTVRSLVIETDAEVDDAVAILYLLKQPTLRVEAIVVEGDKSHACRLERENVLGLLKLAHYPSIPIACGDFDTRSSQHPFFVSLIKEQTQQLHQLLASQSNDHELSANASDVLVDVIQKTAKPIDILALAPLSTVAAFLKQHGELKSKIHQITIMGGAFHVPGNLAVMDTKIKNKRAELNLYLDAQAASQVLHSGVSVMFVPLDVTNKVAVDEKFYSALKNQHQTPAADFAYQLYTINHALLRNWFFWDPLAAAIYANNQLAMIKSHAVTLSSENDVSAGTTRMDQKHGVRALVAEKVDGEKFKRELLEVLNSI